MRHWACQMVRGLPSLIFRGWKPFLIPVKPMTRLTAHVQRPANWRIKLSYPFTTAAGTRIELVELKRLTVKDLKQVRKISKNPADWDEPLIARSTGLLPEDLDNMDLADYLQLQKRFQLITGMGESNQGADAGAGAAGEMVPVSAGGD